jgi:hypothetical protein
MFITDTLLFQVQLKNYYPHSTQVVETDHLWWQLLDSDELPVILALSPLVYLIF